MESIPGGRARARYLGDNRKLIRDPETMVDFPDLSGSVYTVKACTMPSWLIDDLNRIVLEKSVRTAILASVCLRSVSSRLIHPCVYSSQDLARRSKNGRPHSKRNLLQTCRSRLQNWMRSFNCSVMRLKAFFDGPFTVISKTCILTDAETVLTPPLTTGGLS